MFSRIKSCYRLIGLINPELKRKRKDFFSGHDHMNFFEVPIFIVSFNRLTYLQNLVDRLRDMGYTNLNIIDNHSTYPPLLDYYNKTDCRVFRLSKNYGHMVFWECELFRKYREDLYVVTDPDIMLDEDCPDDFVEKLYRCLRKFPRLRKAGLSLKINDIPMDVPLYEPVLNWEKQFYKVRLPFSDFYVANVDTTLALYMPDQLDISRHFLTAVRLAEPYQARHLPWYKRSSDITEEDLFYAKRRITGFWDDTKGEMRNQCD